MMCSPATIGTWFWIATLSGQGVTVSRYESDAIPRARPSYMKALARSRPTGLVCAGTVEAASPAAAAASPRREHTSLIFRLVCTLLVTERRRSDMKEIAKKILHDCRRENNQHIQQRARYSED
jgi:hypothetical protein